MNVPTNNTMEYAIVPIQRISRAKGCKNQTLRISRVLTINSAIGKITYQESPRLFNFLHLGPRNQRLGISLEQIFTIWDRWWKKYVYYRHHERDAQEGPPERRKHTVDQKVLQGIYDVPRLLPLLRCSVPIQACGSETK